MAVFPPSVATGLPHRGDCSGGRRFVHYTYAAMPMCVSVPTANAVLR